MTCLNGAKKVGHADPWCVCTCDIPSLRLKADIRGYNPSNIFGSTELV